MFLIVAALLLAGCGHDEGGGEPAPTAEAAISFSTALEDIETRAAGTIDNAEALQNVSEGFGVLAYLTDAYNWSEKRTETSPNFMLNQQVTYGVLWVDNSDPENPIGHKDWIYDPPKYWPNSTDNATPRRLSFFAYAPYGDGTATTGVTGFPGTKCECSTPNDRLPHVHYTLGEAGSQDDLLYAHFTDAWRNGEGLIAVNSTAGTRTYQKVPLAFAHALARVDVYVQRVYDEEHYSGKAPTDERHTKLFLSRLTLTTGGTLNHSGRLNLETGAWTVEGSSPGDLNYDETLFNDTISGTLSTSEAVIGGTELYKWGLGYNSVSDTFDDEKSFGIDDHLHLLFPADAPLLFLPQTKLTLTPTATYSMVTRDDALATATHTYDGHRYSRIVNKVTGSSATLTLEAGKRYRMVLHIGVETVRLEVVSVEDWDFPMRFRPATDDFEEKPIKHTVDE